MSNNKPHEVMVSGVIDTKKMLTLIYVKGLHPAEAARNLGVSRQAVSKALKPFKAIINTNNEVEAFRENESQILDSLKMKLLFDMVNKDKRKKATLGNVAYAYDKIATHSRLEKGLSTAIYDIFAIKPEEEAALMELGRRVLVEMRQSQQDVIDVTRLKDSDDLLPDASERLRKPENSQDTDSGANEV